MVILHYNPLEGISYETKNKICLIGRKKEGELQQEQQQSMQKLYVPPCFLCTYEVIIQLNLHTALVS